MEVENCVVEFELLNELVKDGKMTLLEAIVLLIRDRSR